MTIFTEVESNGKIQNGTLSLELKLRVNLDIGTRVSTVMRSASHYWLGGLNVHLMVVNG